MTCRYCFRHYEHATDLLRHERDVHSPSTESDDDTLGTIATAGLVSEVISSFDTTPDPVTPDVSQPDSTSDFSTPDYSGGTSDGGGASSDF